MVGEGICRRAYWQAQVQCSIASDLSAPLTCVDNAASRRWRRDRTSNAESRRVARIDCPRGKKNSTFFENMGYRGQSCDDWQMLMMSLVDPFFDDLFNEKC